MSAAFFIACISVMSTRAVAAPGFVVPQLMGSRLGTAVGCCVCCGCRGGGPWCWFYAFCCLSAVCSIGQHRRTARIWYTRPSSTDWPTAAQCDRRCSLQHSASKQGSSRHRREGEDKRCQS
jgi:hypothetical protein